MRWYYDWALYIFVVHPKLHSEGYSQISSIHFLYFTSHLHISNPHVNTRPLFRSHITLYDTWSEGDVVLPIRHCVLYDVIVSWALSIYIIHAMPFWHKLIWALINRDQTWLFLMQRKINYIWKSAQCYAKNVHGSQLLNTSVSAIISNTLHSQWNELFFHPSYLLIISK